MSDEDVFTLSRAGKTRGASQRAFPITDVLLSGSFLEARVPRPTAAEVLNVAGSGVAAPL